MGRRTDEGLVGFRMVVGISCYHVFIAILSASEGSDTHRLLAFAPEHQHTRFAQHHWPADHGWDTQDNRGDAWRCRADQ
jgi:hypothetical protein